MHAYEIPWIWTASECIVHCAHDMIWHVHYQPDGGVFSVEAISMANKGVWGCPMYKAGGVNFGDTSNDYKIYNKMNMKSQPIKTMNVPKILLGPPNSLISFHQASSRMIPNIPRWISRLTSHQPSTRNHQEPPGTLQRTSCIHLTDHDFAGPPEILLQERCSHSWARAHGTPKASKAQWATGDEVAMDSNISAYFVRYMYDTYIHPPCLSICLPFDGGFGW